MLGSIKGVLGGSGFALGVWGLRLGLRVEV